MTAPPLRVLCVDDDADIRTITLLALGLDGEIEAQHVGSGAEALALLEALTWRPDVILCDVTMRGMTGPELFTAIRDRPAIADIPVIFMTARAGPSARSDYRALGALGVIAKPFDPLGLAGEVRALFDGRSGATTESYVVRR